MREASSIQHSSICKGFTLIELLVVIAIISILSSIASASMASLLRRCSINQERYVGKNPQSRDLNCGKSAKTLYKGWYKGYRLELRRSSRCQMTWARTNAPKGTIMYVMDADKRRYGIDFVVDSSNGNGINQFSFMGPRSAQSACIKLPSDAKYFCVGPYFMD